MIKPAIYAFGLVVSALGVSVTVAAMNVAAAVVRNATGG